MRNVVSMGKLTSAIVVVMLAGACKEYEQLAGTLALDAQPVLLKLKAPYTTTGPTREVCFGVDSATAFALEAGTTRVPIVLIDTAGNRELLGESSSVSVTPGPEGNACLSHHGLYISYPAEQCYRGRGTAGRPCTVVSDDSLAKLARLPRRRRVTYGSLEISSSHRIQVQYVKWWSGQRQKL